MNNLLRTNLKIVVVCLVLGMQMFFLTSQTAQAQLIPDAIDTTKTQENKLPVYDKGVDQSISEYLCTPTGLGTDLVDCVGRLYRFGISFGAIALVFFVVLAGYLYITGGETAKGKAKNILLSAFTGMTLLLVSYVLLNFINPTLTEIRPIQPPIFSGVDLPSCEEIGFGANCIISTGPNTGQVFSAGNGKSYGGRGCKPITNNNSPASIDNLKKTCWGKYGDQVVKNASIVAANESGGTPIPVNQGSCGPGRQPARCVGGEIPVFGVFQINLMAHQVAGLNCPSAFAKIPNGKSFCSVRCEVTNKNLYNQCYAALQKINDEFEVACKIYDKNIAARRPGFNDWGNSSEGNEHGRKCGF